MSNKITEPFLILSEGNADRTFLKHLLEVREIKHNFEFFFNEHKYGAGNTAFGAMLLGMITERGFEDVRAILIVTDCDENPTNSFEKIQQQIEEAKFTVPNKPFEIVKTKDLPDLVVIMIPFDNVCGNLESYIVRAMEKVWNNVKLSADRHINETPASIWETCKQAKSVMQSMIAVLNEEDPNKSLAYIWSNNNDFRELLKDEVFDELADYLEKFPSLFERE